MLDLEPIKYRLAAATPGPWSSAESAYLSSALDSFFSVAVVGRCEVLAKIPHPVTPAECDADLIANAPSDLTALVAEVEWLRADADVRERYIAALEPTVRRLQDAIKAHHQDKTAPGPTSVNSDDRKLWAVLP